MLKSLTASTPENLCRIVNGIVLSKRTLNLGYQGQGVSPLLYKHKVGGLTLNWINGAVPGTITFASDLNFQEIVAAIEAVTPGSAHLFKVDAGGGLALAFWDDNDGVSVLAGTANSYFGFSASSETQITKANAVTHVVVDSLSHTYTAFYNE